MIALCRLLPWVFASLCFLLSATAEPSHASTNVDKRQDVFTYFYKDPRPERLIGFLQTFSEAPGGENWIAYPPVAGFLAVVFRRHPDVVHKILPERPSPRVADAVRAAA